MQTPTQGFARHARACALCAALAAGAAAQEGKAQQAGTQQEKTRQETTLAPVVVTGSNVPDPSLTLPALDTARRRIATVPGGANAIDGDSYREGRVSTLNDALGYAPGVFSASRFGAEEARLSIRGSGIQRTFHLRGVRLLQDGVPLNLADGSGDFQAIEPLHTRYIEVYRGANALQYGSSTLGGAINYVSVTGHDNWRLLARGEAGSFGYLRSQITGGGTAGGNVSGNGSGPLDWAATYSTFDQDGFRDHAVQHAQRATANAGYRISPQAETRFFFSFANSDSQLPGSLTKAQLQADPRQANAASLAGNQKRDIDWARLSNRTVLRFGEGGEGRLELHAWYSDKTLFHPIFQVLDQKNDDYGGELRWVSEAPLLGRRNLLTAGISPTRGSIAERRWLNLAGSRGAQTNQFDQLATNLDLYVENQHYVGERTALVLGAQHTKSRRRNRDLFIAPGEGDESFDARYSGTSPRIGLRHEYRPTVQFFANWSGSFEPPSFGELAGGLAPNIVRAQKARTLEIGGRGRVENTRLGNIRLGDIEWDVAAYRANVRDELLQTLVFPAGNSPAPAPQTVNAPRTVHQGIELGAGGRFLRRFEWRQALAINRFRFDGHPAFGDNTLPGLPESLLKAELVYRAGGGGEGEGAGSASGSTGGFYAGVNLEYSPQRYPVDMANTFYADRYAVWGAKVGQRIGSRWSWFVEGRNLGNKKYAATTGVTLNQAGLDGAQFLPGDGRGIYAGVELKM